MRPPRRFDSSLRQANIDRMSHEVFDLLVIGGGITGAAVARDAAQRGLTVALVERNDYASGTSSRSSKLIHGGLRYLEKLEFRLVFEALKERTLLLRTLPTLVKPLPFYFPIYEGERPGRLLLGAGMWFYDLLALFRAPKMHKAFGRAGLLKEVPGLREQGLLGGFRYYDASMRDDVMTAELVRAASNEGAVVANYVEAVEPIRGNAGEISGFTIQDREAGPQAPLRELRARRVVACTGPFIDHLGAKLSPNWRARLKPSKGVHLVFSRESLPVPGAIVMAHPDDKRISFVMDRPDLGVVIVGTTDGPTPPDASQARVDRADVDYLLALVNRTLPAAKVTVADIISAYVGVRPLVASPEQDGVSLQEVSREHHIEEGPGGVLWVAGGKYTTHRPMATEIVDAVLESWEREFHLGKAPQPPARLQRSRTEEASCPEHTAEWTRSARREASRLGIVIDEILWSRYGAEALEVAKIALEHPSAGQDPVGFPWLEAQLRFEMRRGMVMHLDDFAIRRTSLFLARRDHGMPWMVRLSHVWAEEKRASRDEARVELQKYEVEVRHRDSWRST